MIHYYLIHGIDPERKPFMENQFETFGVPKEHTTWITYPNKTDPIPTHITTNPYAVRGILSCGYKHYLALKDICDNGYEYGVIMEDNISFNGNVPEAIAKYMKDMPNDWDILFDSDFFNIHHLDFSPSNSTSVYKLEDPDGKGTKGAHFYLLKLSFAKKLCDIFLPFYMAPDHHMNGLFTTLRPNIYWAEPPNVHKITRLSTWMDTPVFNILIGDKVHSFAPVKPIAKKKKLSWLKTE